LNYIGFLNGTLVRSRLFRLPKQKPKQQLSIFTWKNFLNRLLENDIRVLRMKAVGWDASGGSVSGWAVMQIAVNMTTNIGLPAVKTQRD
jgi:hypothetical protein